MDDLAYFPANVDLADLDLDQPQRIAADVANATGMEVLDLRPALLAASECPYQPSNMHWLEHGHEVATEAIISHLSTP